jgi:hypothetical protein
MNMTTRTLILLILTIILLALVPIQAHAAPAGPCAGWGTVTNVSPYPSGRAWWVAVHLDNGAWTSFRTIRPFRVDQRVYVIGCPGADRYVERPFLYHPWR